MRVSALAPPRVLKLRLSFPEVLSCKESSGHQQAGLAGSTCQSRRRSEHRSLQTRERSGPAVLELRSTRALYTKCLGRIGFNCTLIRLDDCWSSCVFSRPCLLSRIIAVVGQGLGSLYIIEICNLPASTEQLLHCGGRCIVRSLSDGSFITLTYTLAVLRLDNLSADCTADAVTMAPQTSHGYGPKIEPNSQSEAACFVVKLSQPRNAEVEATTNRTSKPGRL